MIEKLKNYVEKNKWSILGILSLILLTILAILGYRSVYNKGVRDGMNRRKTENKKYKRSEYQRGYINGMKSTIDRVKDEIDKADTRGFDRGYNYPGSTEIKNNQIAKEYGIRTGIKFGREQILEELKEPNINTPSQLYLAKNFNIILAKESQVVIDKMIDEGRNLSYSPDDK